MRSRSVPDAPVQTPALDERTPKKLRQAVVPGYAEMLAATFLTAVVSEYGREARREGPLGCLVELLEEFLAVAAQPPRATTQELLIVDANFDLSRWRPAAKELH